MHIVLMIVGLITAASVWYWRLQVLGRAAKDATDVAKTVANLPRRLSFQRKTGKSGLALVEDPRDAAALIMLEVARADGEVTGDAKRVFIEQLAGPLGMSEDDANETYVSASWLGRDVPAAPVVIAKMARVILKSPHIDAGNVEELRGMLLAVATADGPVSAAQRDLLETFDATIDRGRR